MGHVHLKLVAWKQLGVATGTLAAGEPARQKLLVLTMETLDGGVMSPFVSPLSTIARAHDPAV